MKFKLLFIILFFGLASFISADKFSKETVIYIVRHAEKDVSNKSNSDPVLNAQGKIRAKDLVIALKKEKFDAVFSTAYKRSMETGAPTAQRSGLPVLNYSDIKELVNTVKNTYTNKTILVVGHSNTILDIAKAFDTQPPMETLQDDDYDFLLKVTINKHGKSELKISRYGQQHHSTKISK
ncbi:phosphoglycerate mutase family protein [Daejeonella oryzae]|uniref:phosphoglycerate mutase family protein n=1 Tax=Daejeonella oryzae TaxID=1122943 RepID=UPI0004235A06|nr:phosphoglycerate mutase family protein [Daejeonella oryzae]